MWGGSSHANLHRAENQGHGREDQLPSRRGRLGLIIPAATLGLFTIAVIVYLVAG